MSLLGIIIKNYEVCLPYVALAKAGSMKYEVCRVLKYVDRFKVET